MCEAHEDQGGAALAWGRGVNGVLYAIRNVIEGRHGGIIGGEPDESFVPRAKCTESWIGSDAVGDQRLFDIGTVLASVSVRYGLRMTSIFEEKLEQALF